MSLETSYIKSSTAGWFEYSIHRLAAKYSMLTFEQKLSMSVAICAGGQEGRQGAQLVAAAVDCHSEILLLPFFPNCPYYHTVRLLQAWEGEERRRL